MSPVKGRTNLQERILSAIVLIALTLVLSWAGGVWFRLLASAIAAAVLYEWLVMMRGEVAPGQRALIAVSLAALLLALLAGVGPLALMLLLALATIAAAALGLPGDGRTWPAGGLAYAGIFAVALSGLRGSEPAGLSAVIFLFAVVWATDIFAYVVGRAFGGPKLAPRISPGKTWSGAIGGAVFGLAAGLVCAVALGTHLNILVVVLLSLLLSAVSQIGDLFESALKRRFGAKDSGALIPGHGGVMDRVDGLVAAALVMYATGAASAGLATPWRAYFLN